MIPIYQRLTISFLVSRDSCEIRGEAWIVNSETIGTLLDSWGIFIIHILQYNYKSLKHYMTSTHLSTVRPRYNGNRYKAGPDIAVKLLNSNCIIAFKSYLFITYKRHIFFKSQWNSYIEVLLYLLATVTRPI